MMDVIPLFSTPICYDEYTLDTNEIELIEKENNSKDYPQSRIDRYEKMGFFQEQE